MSQDDIRDQILRIEAHIEELTERIERCSKLILLSKITIAIGGIWLLAITLGAVWFDPTTLIGAIAVVIGGIVVFGSNTSTLKQASLDIKADEALRAELIDGLISPGSGKIPR